MAEVQRTAQTMTAAPRSDAVGRSQASTLLEQECLEVVLFEGHAEPLGSIAGNIGTGLEVAGSNRGREPQGVVVELHDAVTTLFCSRQL